jgi:hypothetical protein
MSQPPLRRTGLADFVLDLISIVEEQVDLAKKDPSLQQQGAVVVCSDAVCILKLRLRENEHQLTKCMLVCKEIFNAHWRSEWDKLGEASPAKFEIEANNLLEDMQRIRFVLSPAET